MPEEPLQNTKRYLKHRSFGQAHPAAYKTFVFPVSASDHPRSAAPRQYASGTVSPGKSSRYPRRNGRDCGQKQKREKQKF